MPMSPLSRHAANGPGGGPWTAGACQDGHRLKSLQPLVHFLGTFEVHADAPATHDVPDPRAVAMKFFRRGRAEDERVASLCDEAHRDELRAGIRSRARGFHEPQSFITALKPPLTMTQPGELYRLTSGIQRAITWPSSCGVALRGEGSTRWSWDLGGPCGGIARSGVYASPHGWWHWSWWSPIADLPLDRRQLERHPIWQLCNRRSASRVWVTSVRQPPATAWRRRRTTAETGCRAAQGENTSQSHAPPVNSAWPVVAVS